MCLIVSRSLAEGHRGNDCILIPGMGADEAAVALLETEEVSAFSALLKAQDLLADVLEAGQNLDETKAVGFRDGVLPCLW